MLAFQVRRAFERHRAADIDVGGLDVGLGEAEAGKQIEVLLVEFLRWNLQRVLEEVGAKRPFVEDEFDVEGATERGFNLGDRGVGKALRPSARRR